MRYWMNLRHVYLCPKCTCGMHKRHFGWFYYATIYTLRSIIEWINLKLWHFELWIGKL